jgi:hypothetical protein
MPFSDQVWPMSNRMNRAQKLRKGDDTLSVSSADVEADVSYVEWLSPETSNDQSGYCHYICINIERFLGTVQDAQEN